MRRAPRVTLLFLLGALLACSGGGAGAGPGANPDLIGSWELQEVAQLNGLQAIERLRPRWLRTRTSGGPITSGVEGMYGVRLHIDGSPQNSLEVLEQFQAGDIREMRFLDGPAATTRFGTNYTNGVILVTTER